MGEHYFLNVGGDGIYKMGKSVEEAPERCIEHKGSAQMGRTIRVMPEHSLLALNQADSGVRLVKVGQNASSFEVLNFDDVIISLKDHQFSAVDRLTIIDDPEIRVYSFNFLSKKVEKIAEWQIPIDLHKQEVATTLAVDPFCNNYCVQTQGLGGIASRLLVLGLSGASFTLRHTVDLMSFNIGDIRAMSFIGYKGKEGSLVCIGDQYGNVNNGQSRGSVMLNFQVAMNGACKQIGKDDIGLFGVVRFAKIQSRLMAFGVDMRKIEISA